MANTFDTTEKLATPVDFVSTTDPDMAMPETANTGTYIGSHRAAVMEKPEPDTTEIEGEVFDLDLSGEDEDEEFDEDDEADDFDEDEDEV